MVLSMQKEVYQTIKKHQEQFPTIILGVKVIPIYT